MEKVLIDFDQNEWAKHISEAFQIKEIKVSQRSFPDMESYFRLEGNVKKKDVIIVCSLNEPNSKTLDLVLLSELLRANGAAKVGLVAPYLSYMRQDKVFNPGEGITAKYFASLISKYFDWLITVDPHLHRIHSLDKVYTIPTFVIESAPFISEWIGKNIKNPLIIGPDGESKQWVKKVADAIQAPYEVLEKIRLGDENVKETIPHLDNYKKHTPVLVDDIISTAQTMIQAVKNIQSLKMKQPYCIGIHGLFAGHAFADLVSAGVKEIITCNTIAHPTNKIDVSKGLTTLF